MLDREKFGELLSKAIKKAAAHEHQLVGALQDELGYKLGRAGGSAIERWRKGFLPPKIEDVAVLARELAKSRAFSGAEELRLFLQYANHPYPNKLCEEIFPNSAATISLQEADSKSDIQHIPFLAPPRTTYSIVGREQIITTLKHKLISENHHPFSAITGLPGSGKTALSIALVYDHEILNHFYDGVLWVALGANPDLSMLLNLWGSALNIPISELSQFSSINEKVQRIKTVIGMRRMLLIIDDVWRIEDALAFKLGGPNCAHLLTTRLPTIGIDFAGNDIIPIAELSEFYSFKLLSQFIPETVDIDLESLKQLINDAGGLPLSLILVGRYLQRIAYQNQSRLTSEALSKFRSAKERLEITQALSPLAHSSTHPKGASLSLLSAIEVSVDSLDDDARLMLWSLSVFPSKPNTFNKEAALAVADKGLNSFDNLINSGLLEISGERRFTLHQSIVDYAHFKHIDVPAEKRMALYFIKLLITQNGTYADIETEFNNVRYALELAAKHELNDEFIEGVNRIFDFLEIRGLYDFATQLFEEAEQLAKQSNNIQELAILFLNMGRVSRFREDYKQAEHFFKEGLLMAQENDWLEMTSIFLVNLGRMEWHRDEFKKAKDYSQRGLDIAKESNIQKEISEALIQLGNIAIYEGNLTQAKEYFQEALSLVEQSHSISNTCKTLNGLGAVAHKQGEIKLAEDYFRRSLFYAKEIGYWEVISGLLWNLGALATNRNAYKEAKQCFEEALSIARNLNYRENISPLLMQLGWLARIQGDLISGESYLSQALTIAEEIGSRSTISNINHELGQLHLALGNLTLASKKFNESLEIAREINVHEVVGRATFGLAKIALAMDNVAEAFRLGSQSYSIFEEIGLLVEFEEVQEWLNRLQ